MDERHGWRVVVGNDDPIPFHTERGARTAAAIRSRGGRAAPVVEYLDHRGRWQPAGPTADELYEAAKRRNRERVKATRPSRAKADRVPG